MDDEKFIHAYKKRILFYRRKLCRDAKRKPSVT